ncbi:MAG: T9SS type A sorting domain-containing protein [Bacteroidetes bacterium]|nr:T9SS type A sorting domain-containing protein [Bacteroidota bacterium]
MKKCYLILFFIGIAIQSNAQLSSGLVANWKFNGNVRDSTGNGHNGTANNITYTTGRYGAANGAAVFNGTSSYVTTPYLPDYNLTNFSLCTIIKINGFYTGPCQGNVIFQRGVDGNTGTYGFSYSDTLPSCSGADTNIYTVYNIVGALPIAGNQWHYPFFLHSGRWYSMISTFDGNKVKIYINGNLVDSATPSSVTAIGTSTDSAFIGGNYNGVTGGYPYWLNANLDDLRIYNRVLTNAEIAQYNVLDSPTAISPVNANNIDVNIYPNPASNHVTISGYVRTAIPLQLDITNSIGQIVYTETISTNGMYLNKDIDTRNYSNGIYFVRIKTDSGIKTMKLQVE